MYVNISNNIQQLKESRGKTSDKIWWKVTQRFTGHYRITRKAPNPDWEGLDRHLEESDPGAGVLKDEQEFTRLRIKGGGEDIPERGNRCTKGAGWLAFHISGRTSYGWTTGRERTEQHEMRLRDQRSDQASRPKHITSCASSAVTNFSTRCI